MMAAEIATRCTAAYDSARAVLDAIRAQDPNSPKPVSRAAFETECARLPSTHQRCMTIEYSVEHPQECNAILRFPELEAFREAMRRARELE